MAWKSRDLPLKCAEYSEWMEWGYFKTTKTGRPYHYYVSGCGEVTPGINGIELPPDCKGRDMDDSCDGCDIRLCTYMAKEVDGDKLCPACWADVAVPEDDRNKEQSCTNVTIQPRDRF